MAKKKAKPSTSDRSAKGGRSPARKRKPPAAQPKPVAQPKLSVASQLPQPSSEQIQAAKKKFEQGILARGEAVPAGQPLPPGATHEIVTSTDGSPPVLKRKRYSLR